MAEWLREFLITWGPILFLWVGWHLGRRQARRDYEARIPEAARDALRRAVAPAPPPPDAADDWLSPHPPRDRPTGDHLADPRLLHPRDRAILEDLNRQADSR